MADPRSLGLVCRKERLVSEQPLTCQMPRLYTPRTGPVYPANQGMDALNSSLELLRTESLNFGYRLINDGAVRAAYLRNTELVAKTLLQEVQAGRLSPANAAREANQIRNSIMEAARISSSDIGRASAEALKATGKTLPELEALYANQLFKQAFKDLSEAEKNQVWLEIVAASGRPRPAVNLRAMRWSRLGKGLVLLAAAVAVYNVVTAEDPKRQAAKEVVSGGAGVLGGMAVGALAGLACGPGAPVCVGIGVFVGGVLAAFGADLAFDRIF